jgi:hypothetical protein
VGSGAPAGNSTAGRAAAAAGCRKDGRLQRWRISEKMVGKSTVAWPSQKRLFWKKNRPFAARSLSPPRPRVPLAGHPSCTDTVHCARDVWGPAAGGRRGRAARCCGELPGVAAGGGCGCGARQAEHAHQTITGGDTRVGAGAGAGAGASTGAGAGAEAGTTATARRTDRC